MNNTFIKITDFSNKDSISRVIISSLFNAIQKNKSYQQYYLNWKKVFIFLHGELDSQRKINTVKIKEKYDVEIVQKEDLFVFAFALEIYYSVLLKLIAYRKLNGEAPSDTLMANIISGNYFLNKHLLNYSSPNYYNFVGEIDEIQQHLIDLLEIIHSNPKIENDFDFIKIIYEALFPKELRHSMGEFYTPDWLAEFTINNLIKGDNSPRDRLYLDPTCGSGTFLFCLMRIFINHQDKLRNQIFGIDINPLAILAAKTNFILFLRQSPNEDILLPFFNTDLIKHPKYENEKSTLFDINNDQYSITIQQTKIIIPIKNYKLADVVSLHKAFTRNDKSALPSSLTEIFRQIKGLTNNQRLEFLDRFALIALRNIDYIVGNPPWVNWEYLPKNYKKETEKVWQYYELFDYKGLNSIFIKEDISSLITYVAVDNHLKEGGKTGFILKESLFKSSKQGAGFRKFFLPKTKTPLYPYLVHDLTEFSPFIGVNNKTFILFLTKGSKWEYPVSFIEWVPKGMKSFGEFEKIDKVIGSFNFIEKLALPLDKNDHTSGWITLNEKNNTNLARYLGKPDYKARTGVFTGGANAIFWLRILNESTNKTIEVANITERAKNKMAVIQATLEKEFVYPLITGSDISLWHYEYSRYILLPHNKTSKMYPVSIEALNDFPLTKKYFEEFKKELEERKGFTSFDKKIHIENYYTLQRIGEYTFEPYKVAWRYIAKEFTPCVIESVIDMYLGKKNSIPNEKVIYIGLNQKDEAYYLCGLLSSKTIREIINSFIVNIQISPSTINNIKLMKFDKENTKHQEISKLCYEGHRLKDKEFHLNRIDEIVQELYQSK
ncbi:MAG: N-6 DNA methylase [bacterium]